MQVPDATPFNDTNIRPVATGAVPEISERYPYIPDADVDNDRLYKVVPGREMSVTSSTFREDYQMESLWECASLLGIAMGRPAPSCFDNEMNGAIVCCKFASPSLF